MTLAIFKLSLSALLELLYKNSHSAIGEGSWYLPLMVHVVWVVVVLVIHVVVIAVRATEARAVVEQKWAVVVEVVLVVVCNSSSSSDCENSSWSFISCNNGVSVASGLLNLGQ